MATPILTEKNQFKYEIEFSRGASATTRSFTIDTTSLSAGLSAAQEFQSFLAGTGGFSVASIVPNQFIQPAGWRDDDPDEDPWTTEKVSLTGIRTEETFYGTEGGGGGGGGGGDLELEYDPSEGVIIKFDGQTQTSLVKAFAENGTALTVEWDTGSHYHFIEAPISTPSVTVVVLDGESTMSATIAIS